ncbi:hypothetical protein ACFSSC_09500 [Corynebacterium mendelii]|uniref:DUF1980 domain-containing protein n=1 Tax=Corynebacterium mendelii TaxID=2765362 RepID=A0A939E3R2_9CORY|nr:hypothetical protein [Corynebacterium mendelii]MBN9645213.1 hypothetical protein [Corynebacterium mendelii]
MTGAHHTTDPRGQDRVSAATPPEDPHGGHSHAHSHSGGTAPGRAAQRSAAVWLVFATMVGALVATGRAGNYVRGFWLPILGVVALAVLVLSAAVLWRGRGQWRPVGSRLSVMWLLVVPVALVSLCAPSPLGAAMLSSTTTGGDNRVARTARAAKASSGISFPELSDSGVNEMTLEELSDRFNFDDPAKLEGKQLSVIGFISHKKVTGVEPGRDSDAGPAGGAGQIMLNRFKIYCCAADAIAYTAVLDTEETFDDDTWVTVTGTIVPGQSTPTLSPASIEPIHQPKAPYLS